MAAPRKTIARHRPGTAWRKAAVERWRRRRRKRAAAVPFTVMKQLAREALPLDREAYSQRLSELLVAIQQNGDSHGSQR
jgi:hypothetical protein